MKTLHLITLLFILTFIQNLTGQTITKKLVGSETYINRFNWNAKKIGIDDLRLSKDSLRIRIWNEGKLIDLNINGDSISVRKIIYMITNPSYKRDIKRKTIIFKEFEITKEQKELIRQEIRLICLNNPLGRNIELNRDSFYMNYNAKVKLDTIPTKVQERVGGVTESIEFANKQEYLWTSWITCSHLGETIKQLMDDLEMGKDQKLFCKNLPYGAWYSSGGTSAWYKASFLESLYRGFIWK